MCGFVAIVNTNSTNIQIGSLLNIINHRGPDDHGWVNWDAGLAKYGKDDELLSGEVVLGHTRLSIIDLSAAGWQPMESDDNKYNLVFNGEIYNYIELREELVRNGSTFKSNSDTEVLLEALIKWGENAIAKLRGMFAFCFFDSVSRKFIVARDPFGIKPLYYGRWEGGIAFASEAKVLMALPGVPKSINPQSIYEYLILGVTDHGSQSCFEGLFHLPAGHILTCSIDNIEALSIKCYWSINLNVRTNPTFNQAVTKVRELFLQSVELHLRSDVPIGAALSGGIDSSAIVCAIRHINPQQELHTFSFIADDNAINEEKWIDIVNTHASCIPHKVFATKDELIADIPHLITAQDEPFGSTSIYAQYRVFREASHAGIKVMLDGQGADEMLGGYISYQGSRLATLLCNFHLFKAIAFLNKSSKLPGRSKKMMNLYAANELIPDWSRAIARMLISKGVPPKWLSNNWLQKNIVHIHPRIISRIPGKDKLRARLLESLTRSSIPRLLRYEDRNSMHFSIESRVPFLHIDLVEYIYSLPEEFLISPNGTSKYVFREAMRGIVPDAILDRNDKIGFATPEKSWLSNMENWVFEQLKYAEKLPCFDPSALIEEWNNVIHGRVAFDFRCWRWLNLIAWVQSNGIEVGQ